MSHLLESILPKPVRPIIHVLPDVSIAQCVEIMLRDNIGALVVKDDDQLFGILSERDIIRSMVYKGLSANSTQAIDILCANISILKPSDTLEKAMQTIINTKRRHLLVADGDNLLAIISIGDLLLNILEDKEEMIEHLQNYIQTY